MIRALFDFTRTRFRGPLPITPVATDLAEVLRPIVEEVRTAWPERAIELAVRGDARGEWDPVRMGPVPRRVPTDARAKNTVKTPW
jgi:hypothetical protein